MSLSAERVAIANRAIQQTFEKSSIAWQAIPHWDTGDPGQVRVRSDVITTIQNRARRNPLGVTLISPDSRNVLFRVTLAQATAATPDALLASVLPRTVRLAAQFDRAVLRALRTPAIRRRRRWYRALAAPAPVPAAGAPAAWTILDALIRGRAVLENQGYRAQSCLIAGTAYFADLSQWISANMSTRELLTGPNVNSLFRAGQLDGIRVRGARRSLMIMIGRHQDITHGAAGSASAGEEPVDIAVCVPPSLEVIGGNAAGQIDLAVRIRFATRVKDERGIVVFHT